MAPRARNTRNRIVFYLNGSRREVSDERAGWMLADYLRYDRGLTGTKIVCAEGDCGACTALRYFPGAGKTFSPINSCIVTVAQLDGSSVVTVDALAEENPKTRAASLSPVQEAMVGCHGSQCGFCTPGFVMALAGLVERKLETEAGSISRQDAKNWLTGNLCRCTGYEPIIEAAESIPLARCRSVRSRYWSAAQEKDLRAALATPVELEAGSFSFYAPRTLKDAAAYLRKHRGARVLAAGTDLGVVHNKRKLRLERVVSLHLVPELYELSSPSKSRLRVGARVTLSELRRAVEARIPELARFLDLFASPQIKNVATLVGNVCNASPIADTPPFLLAANAVIHVAGGAAKRSIPIEKFYLDYRKTALKPGELAVAIEFDVPAKGESLALYKVSQRKDLDISTVNAAFRVSWKDRAGGRPSDIRIAMGGMGPTPLRLRKTESALRESGVTPQGVKRALEVFHSEMKPISDLRGSAAFRRVASENLFLKFFMTQATPKGKGYHL